MAPPSASKGAARLVERNDGRLACQSIAVGRLGSGPSVRWVWLLVARQVG